MAFRDGCTLHWKFPVFPFPISNNYFSYIRRILPQKGVPKVCPCSGPLYALLLGYICGILTGSKLKVYSSDKVNQSIVSYLPENLLALWVLITVIMLLCSTSRDRNCIHPQIISKYHTSDRLRYTIILYLNFFSKF